MSGFCKMPVRTDEERNEGISYGSEIRKESM